VVHGPRKKPLDFGGNLDHVMLRVTNTNSSTNKQTHACAYSDKHYAMLTLKLLHAQMI